MAFTRACLISAIPSKSNQLKWPSTRTCCKESHSLSTFSSAPAEGQEHKIKSDSIVTNFCKVQMLSDNLYSQLFIDRYRIRDHDTEIVDKCKDHLKTHSLWQQSVPIAKSIDFKLPLLEGTDINDHFHNIALQQTFKYKSLLDELVKLEIPNCPKLWSMQSGWTKYYPDGSFLAVPYPEENACIFDVEVCQSTGQVPTIACALSAKAWYSWCSPLTVEGNDRSPDTRNTLSDLIPLETEDGDVLPKSGKWTEKMVVGHNVCYDRARIKEQYLMSGTKLRFMDTMSLHIAISGITSFQRALKMAAKKGGNSSDKGTQIMTPSSIEWNEMSSLNNLADVYKLYCGEEISKVKRDIFMVGTIHDIRSDFQNLMAYCAQDVKATHGILIQLMNIFYERFPHPVTFAGMLEMGSTYLPINSNWEKYTKSSEDKFNSLEKEIKSILIEKAEEALKLLPNKAYQHDPWLWDLDWKVTKPRKKKIEDQHQYTNSIASYPAWYKKLLYKPSDPNYQPGPANISTSMRLVPKLLRLCWFGFPMYHSKTGGWGFLLKTSNLENCAEANPNVYSNESTEPENDACNDAETVSFPYKQWETIFDKNKKLLLSKLKKSGLTSNVQILNNEMRNKSEDAAQDLKDFIKGLDGLSRSGMYKNKKAKTIKVLDTSSPHSKCEFRPLPHKDGGSNKVGNPLAKDFLTKIEDGVLTCDGGEDVANKVVRLSKMVSYWRNNRDRIQGQLTVWMKNSELPERLRNEANLLPDYEFGAILPQVSVSGTLTRRAVEPTWMTASNAYEDRVGSELKGIIQAPPSYHFVGADVDSQELWIAAVIGDAHFAGVHGSTALGWMTLQGNKSSGTDVHSKTASLIGIDRDQAKVLNYGRIYGAGVSFAERLLMQFNHQMSSYEARSKARAMYKMTKGERKYTLNPEGQQLAESIEHFKSKKLFSKQELRELMHCSNYPDTDYNDIIGKMVWDNGTESHMFNRLENIAQEECPRTPILKCSISRSLVPSVVQNDFMTSRVNWVVQSSAVDYLHLMLTCMGWLIKKYDIKARFVISVHDEVRYIVESEDRYRAALALQITNIFTRTFCSHQLGIYDLPQSVAFFSCVDVDKVLRKEVHHDCKTPSNPEGLQDGYNIPFGEALSIEAILKHTGGSLKKPLCREIPHK